MENISLEFVKKVSKNGIPVHVAFMPYANTVSSGILVKVGSRDENWPKEAGLAHALEHMLFEGSKKFPTQNELSSYIEEVGGYRNGYTSRDITFFYNQVPCDEFERSIDSLSEQIQYSLVSEEKVFSEMKVVIQELKRSLDSPNRYLFNLAWGQIFKNHPLSHVVLGTESSISQFCRESFINFMDCHYHAGNYTIIIAGKIDPEKAIDMVNKYFTISNSKIINNRATQNKLENVDRQIMETKKINQVYINLSALIPSSDKKEKILLDLFSSMIGLGSSSPLYNEIRDKKGLSYVVGSEYCASFDFGLFTIYMATSLERYQEAIEVALNVIIKEKNNEKLLEKTKKMILGKMALTYENPSSVIRESAYNLVFMGTLLEPKEMRELIKDVSIQEIEKVVEKYLKPEKFFKTTLQPEKL